MATIRIKGEVDLYEHSVPFELDFDLHRPSVEQAIREGEGSAEINVAAYLSDYTGCNCVVKSFMWIGDVSEQTH